MYLTENKYKARSLGTDDKFPDFIESNRTPDVITITDKHVEILEFAVTSDVERALFMKGTNKSNSKYKPELDKFAELGYTTDYKPIIFDITVIEESDSECCVAFKNAFQTAGFLANSAGILFCPKVQVSTSIKNRCFELQEAVMKKLGLIFTTPKRHFRLMTYDKMSFISLIQNKDRVINMISSDRRRANVCLIFDTVTSKWKLSDEYTNKSDKNDLLVYLDNNDYDKLYHFVYLQTGRKVIHSSKSMFKYTHSIQPTYETEVRFDFNTPNFMHRAGKLEVKIDISPDVLNLHAMGCISYPNADWVMNYEEEMTVHYQSVGLTGLSTHELNDEVVEEAIKKFTNKLSKVDGYVKPSFSYPIIDSTESAALDYVNEELCSAVMANVKTACTRDVIQAYRDRRSRRTTHVILDETGRSLQEALMAANTMYHRTLSKSQRMGQLNEISITKEVIDAKLEMINASKKYQSYLKSAGAKLLRQKVYSIDKNQFKDEMGHFIKSTEVTNCKDDYNLLNEEFRELVDFLMSPAPQIPEQIQWSPSDMTFLDDMIASSIKQQKLLYNEFVKLKLAHVCRFISNLCYSLSYISQTATGPRLCHVENLGYKDVILIVKGGRKSFTTKRSKMFRLIYPIHRCVGTFLNKNYSFIDHNEKTYVLTPWMNYHETQMNDGMFCIQKVMSYLINMSARNLVEMPIKQKLRNYILPVILLLHNRRSTEATMHNLRYLIANAMATHSNITEMIEGIGLKTVDKLSRYLMECFSNNYYTFYKNINNFMKNSKSFPSLFLDNHIYTPEDIAGLIYSTYLMSKAPVTQNVEQAMNLKAIMEIHNSYKGGHTFDSVDNQYSRKFVDDKDDDFCYSPKYCLFLGHLMADYITQSTDFKPAEVWSNMLQKPWDTMANTSGLRSKVDSEFFGNKGYYVVYKDLLENKSKYENLMKILESNNGDDWKRKHILKMNQDFLTVVNSGELDQVVFHVVDKIQRGGGREIYVMDIETKKQQQMLEGYFSKLCAKVSNEYISIPSNRRLHNIHSLLFEKEEYKGENYYLTMDCRKWAPKSNLNKYICFVMGMSKFLPASFYQLFMSFFSLYYKKRIYTREKVYEVFSKTLSNSKYLNYFTYDEPKKGYYFEMPYSFVMGIFNYLSSLLHAANQLHASYFIPRTVKTIGGEDLSIVLLCHSDDSGGKIVTKSPKCVPVAMSIYNLLLRNCNHMLSNKKSCISKNYFEFLSTLYMKNQLLSLVPKFFGATNFKPSDSGFFSDLTLVYSKVIELLSMGATFGESYFNQRIISDCIFRFYHVKECDNKIPHIGGGIFAHPLLILLAGSTADIVRLMTHNEYVILKQIAKAVLASREVISDFGIHMPQVMPRFRLQEKWKQFSELTDNELCKEWGINILPDKFTLINLLKFSLLCKNNKFLSAMQDESDTRRYSRSFYYIKNVCYVLPQGKVTLHEAIQIMETDSLLENIGIDEAQYINKLNKQIQFLLSDPITFNNYLEQLPRNFQIQLSNMTTKPIIYVAENRTIDFNIKHTPEEICIYHYSPKLRPLLNGRDYSNEWNQMVKYLEPFDLDIQNIQPDTAFYLIKHLSKRSDKKYYIYSQTTTENRVIQTATDMLSHLSTNSIFKHQMSFFVNRTIPDNIWSSSTNDISRDIIKAVTVLMFKHILDKETDFADRVVYRFNNTSILGKNLENEMKKYLLANLRITNPEFIYSLFNKELYWYHFWSERQRKSLGIWYGVGCLNVSLKNINLMFTFNDNKLVKVNHDVNKPVILDGIMDWYLKSIFQTSSIHPLMHTPSTNTSEGLNFGIDKDTGRFSIQNSQYLILCANETEFGIKSKYKFKPNVDSMYRDGKRIVYTSNGSFQVFTPMNVFKTDRLIVSEIIPVHENKLLLINEDLPHMLRKLLVSEKYMSYNITPDLLIGNFLSSEIAKYIVLYSLNQKTPTVLSCLASAKSHIPNFEFNDPTLIGPEIVTSGKYDLTGLPHHVLVKFTNELFSTIDPLTRSDIVKNLRELVLELNEPHKPIEDKIELILQRYGDFSSNQSLIREIVKDPKLYTESLSYSFEMPWKEYTTVAISTLITSLIEICDDINFMPWLEPNMFSFEIPKFKSAYQRKLIVAFAILCTSTMCIGPPIMIYQVTPVIDFIASHIDYVLSTRCELEFVSKCQRSRLLQMCPISRTYLKDIVKFICHGVLNWSFCDIREPMSTQLYYDKALVGGKDDNTGYVAKYTNFLNNIYKGLTVGLGINFWRPRPFELLIESNNRVWKIQEAIMQDNIFQCCKVMKTNVFVPDDPSEYADWLEEYEASATCPIYNVPPLVDGSFKVANKRQIYNNKRKMVYFITLYYTRPSINNWYLSDNIAANSNHAIIITHSLPLNYKSFAAKLRICKPIDTTLVKDEHLNLCYVIIYNCEPNMKLWTSKLGIKELHPDEIKATEQSINYINYLDDLYMPETSAGDYAEYFDKSQKAFKKLMEPDEAEKIEEAQVVVEEVEKEEESPKAITLSDIFKDYVKTKLTETQDFTNILLNINTFEEKMKNDKQGKWKELKKKLPDIYHKMRDPRQILKYTFQSSQPQLQAEFDVFSQNLLEELLVGNLYITQKSKRGIINQLRAFESTVRRNARFKNSTDRYRLLAVSKFITILINSFEIGEDDRHSKNILLFINDTLWSCVNEVDEDMSESEEEDEMAEFIRKAEHLL